MSKLSPEEKIEIRKKSHRQLMWVGIFSITMMFGGLSSAYIVSKSDGVWVKIIVPEAFFISTMLIILSSISYFFAVKFVSRESHKMSALLVGFTLLLGLGFFNFQMKGWSQLNEQGNYLGGFTKIQELVDNPKAIYGQDYVIMQKGKELSYYKGSFYDKRDVNYSMPIKKLNLDINNNSSSYFFILTGLHVLHLFAGILSLIFVLVKTLRKKYSKNDHIGIKVSAIYWHFLDFLWLYLLGLLYFVG